MLRVHVCVVALCAPIHARKRCHKFNCEEHFRIWQNVEASLLDMRLVDFAARRLFFVVLPTCAWALSTLARIGSGIAGAASWVVAAIFNCCRSSSSLVSSPETLAYGVSPPRCFSKYVQQYPPNFSTLLHILYIKILGTQLLQNEIGNRSHSSAPTE